MDPLLRELRANVEASDFAAVTLYALVDGHLIVGEFCSTHHFTEDFNECIKTRVIEAEMDVGPPNVSVDQLHSLRLANPDAKPDDRYITLRSASSSPWAIRWSNCQASAWTRSRSVLGGWGRGRFHWTTPSGYPPISSMRPSGSRHGVDRVSTSRSQSRRIETGHARACPGRRNGETTRNGAAQASGQRSTKPLPA